MLQQIVHSGIMKSAFFVGLHQNIKTPLLEENEAKYGGFHLHSNGPSNRGDYLQHHDILQPIHDSAKKRQTDSLERVGFHEQQHQPITPW